MEGSPLRLLLFPAGCVIVEATCGRPCRLVFCFRLPVLWTASGSLFYLSCWVPVAMYLMHSVASSAVWP
nr:MAG TPA: Wound-induced protein [Caudoviricetes sp.]